MIITAVKMNAAYTVTLIFNISKSFGKCTIYNNLYSSCVVLPSWIQSRDEPKVAAELPRQQSCNRLHQ